MITPIMLIKATVDGMIARKFGRIVNITSASVKAPIPVLGLSNGARAGLTGFVAGLARQVAAHNVTINNLLPGPFDTDRLRSGIAFQAQKTGSPVEELGADARPEPGRPLRRPRGVRRALRLPLRRAQPATSSARTSCSTAARIPARTNAAPRRGGHPPGGPWNWWAHSPRWGARDA